MPDSEHTNQPRIQNAASSSKWTGRLSLLLRAALPMAILAGGGIAYWNLSVEPEEELEPPAKEQTVRTRVTELHVQDYPVVITTHGVVQSHNEVALSAQVSGQITQISPAFEVGSYFAKGDVLVELDERDYRTAVAVAEAQLLSADSALQLAIADHQRIMGIATTGVITEAELSQAAAIREQAAAALETATAELEQARRDLERTKILAPFDGRVRQKAVGLGQLVSADMPLGVIFAVDFAEVRLPIAGRELQFLDLPEQAGDEPVEVELRDAISPSSTTVWTASIIRTEGALDEDSLELFAIARIDDPFGLKSGHPPLRIGQPVTGSIIGAVLTDVVAVPRIAVRQLDQVFLIDKTELTLMGRTVVPIWSDEEHVIVRDPKITDGSLLSTTHLVYAPDGAKVEIITDRELTASGKSKPSDQDQPVAN